MFFLMFVFFEHVKCNMDILNLWKPTVCSLQKLAYSEYRNVNPEGSQLQQFVSPVASWLWFIACPISILLTVVRWFPSSCNPSHWLPECGFIFQAHSGFLYVGLLVVSPEGGLLSTKFLSVSLDYPSSTLLVTCVRHYSN